jgi:hypothetical protein
VSDVSDMSEVSALRGKKAKNRRAGAVFRGKKWGVQGVFRAYARPSGEGRVLISTVKRGWRGGERV